nr:hypothetical protein [Tanacetum cinerariifolium]
MNPQETQQVVARDEKWVPFTKRVKISSINVRLETIVPQKVEIFQVFIDLVKNSSCFKAFTISTDVSKIFMEQFWYSIKKVQGTNSYRFLLANKKIVNILSIEHATTVPQKVETFQVFIDLVKNSSCFKAFTISTDVSKIFMEQFWYSIKKVQGTNSYRFLLANKKCVVNVDVFRMILYICPKVKGVNFTDVPDDDTTLAFLIKLGYKGPLFQHTNMFVDHMHQPWRTL